MKLNQDKCHLLVSGYKHENIRARIGEEKIWESSKQKLLGVVKIKYTFPLSVKKRAGSYSIYQDYQS